MREIAVARRFHLPWRIETIVACYGGHSLSTGYVRDRGGDLECLVSASTFYVDLGGMAFDAAADGLTDIVAIDLKAELFSNLCVQAQIMTADHDVDSSGAWQAFEDAIARYRGRVAVVVPLASAAVGALQAGGRLRLLIQHESTCPKVLALANLRRLRVPDGSAAARQLGDGRDVDMQASFADALAAHRSNGWSSLHFAAHWDMVAWVETMLDDGVSPNIAETNGATPLHRAADVGSRAVARRLLDAGADPRRLDTNLNERPSDCARRKGHTDVYDLILSYC